jgi:hypothetical protein
MSDYEGDTASEDSRGGKGVFLFFIYALSSFFEYIITFVSFDFDFFMHFKFL